VSIETSQGALTARYGGFSDIQKCPLHQYILAITLYFRLYHLWYGSMNGKGVRPPLLTKEARSVFMELSRRYLTRKLSITEIGGALGGVSISAISQNKRRLEVKRKKDKKLEKKFKKIGLSLSKQ